MSRFLQRPASAIWNFASTLMMIIYGLGLMLLAYFTLMIGVVVVTFVFFFLLSLLPESVAATILSIVDSLTWLARLGVRDGG